MPTMKHNPLSIKLSEYHVRCLRCHWPVVKKYLSVDGICKVCKKSKNI